MRASSCPHAFLGMTSQGLAAIVRTSGNPDVHVILRGGTSGPNYAAEHVQSAAAKLAAARKDSLPSIMVDASHGNSSKNYLNQPKVVADVAEQIRKGDKSITGIMIESNINPGRQDIPTDGSALKPFVSVTDACIDWESTYVSFLHLVPVSERPRSSADQPFPVRACSVSVLTLLNEASLARAAL